MKKSLYIAAAAIVVLSTTLAFNVKKETLPVAKDNQTASASSSQGYALQDQDQWK